MRTSWGALVILLGALVACERSPSTSHPSPTPTPTPTPTPPPTPTPTPPPTPAPPPATPPDARAYPDDAIRAAESAIAQACGKLVYKHGCSSLRHGRIELGVTLDAAGAQTDVDVTSNTVTVDAPMVEKCVTKALGQHTFAPPGDAITITLAFVLADSC